MYHFILLCAYCYIFVLLNAHVLHKQYCEKSLDKSHTSSVFFRALHMHTRIFHVSFSLGFKGLYEVRKILLLSCRNNAIFLHGLRLFLQLGPIEVNGLSSHDVLTSYMIFKFSSPYRLYILKAMLTIL